jgi:hypothetical protein
VVGDLIWFGGGSARSDPALVARKATRQGRGRGGDHRVLLHWNMDGPEPNRSSHLLASLIL